MTRIRLCLLLVAACLFQIAPAFGQQDSPSNGLGWYTIVKPWHEGAAREALSQAAAASTIPLWPYSVTSSRDGGKYGGTIVGRDPSFHGARSTGVRVFLVPLKIVMPDTGHAFDPTAADPSCLGGKTALALSQGSPIFQAPSTDWIMNGQDVGSGQYNDAFRRAEFFDNVSPTGDRYHTALNPVTTVSLQTFNVPAGEGQTYDASALGGCGKIGVVDIGAMDSFLLTKLIPALAPQGVGPTNFPFFLLYNVVMGAPGTNLFGNCCVIGYHGANGTPMQTYSPTDFDSTGLFIALHNTSVFAHEIGEWLDDPTGNNPTPLWGHTGQVSGCQGNLEVGDPLSGHLFPSVKMPNGFTYSLQELAFFSWFYGSPSIGAGHIFSNNGTFTKDAGPPCT
jgi:hypothetical protein